MSIIARNGRPVTDRRKGEADLPTRADPEPGRRQPSPAFMKRLELLPLRDRAIVELTIGSNLSRAGIARALGITPGQVTRRLRVLYARLHDPLVVALFDDRCPLPPEYRQLGTEHFLLGTSPRELADKHRMSASEIRRMLVFLRGWREGAAGQ
jgi:DNA-directed RNA polymerase specialized sigma24 family protein